MTKWMDGLIDVLGSVVGDGMDGIFNPFFLLLEPTGKRSVIVISDLNYLYANV